MLWRALVLLGLFCLCAAPSARTDAGEWPVYGADKAGSKYSPLAQIDRHNFSTLEVV